MISCYYQAYRTVMLLCLKLVCTIQTYTFSIFMHRCFSIYLVVIACLFRVYVTAAFWKTMFPSFSPQGFFWGFLQQAVTVITALNAGCNTNDEALLNSIRKLGHSGQAHSVSCIQIFFLLYHVEIGPARLATLPFAGLIFGCIRVLLLSKLLHCYQIRY